LDLTHFWNFALQWVVLNPLIAYATIFLAALLESLALVGLLVPGTVMMIGVGALAGTGALSLKITLLSAMIGAVAGDGISYWLGRHYHQGLKSFWPFSRYPLMLAHGEMFFQRHGGMSVLLGRFVGPVRAVIPLIAGMMDMPPGRFVLINIISSIGWAFAYILPGVVLGNSLTLVGFVSMRLCLLLLLLGLILWLAFWSTRKSFGLLKRLGPKGEQLLLPLLCLTLFLSSWLFLGVLEDVISMDPLVQADQAIYQFLQSIRTSWGDRLLIAVSELGDNWVNSFIAAAVLLILTLYRNLRASGYWLVAISGGAGFIQLFKWILHRPRPIFIYQGVSSWGFPSGHTTMSVVLYGFLAILLVRSFPSRWRWLPFSAAIGMSLLIAFSRLYLGAHWFSDVLGGLSLGWAWATLLGIFYLRRPKGELPWRTLLISVSLVLILTGGWHIHRHHAQDLSRYQIQKPLQSLNSETWLQKDWQQLPGWRIDLAGEVEQPLTFQWAGDPEQLAWLLINQGWASVTENDFRQLLNLFIPHVSVQQLPLLPLLENGRQERLLLSLHHGEKRLVLRLWPTEYRLSDLDRSIWVGTVESERAYPVAGLLTLPRGVGDFTAALQILRQALSQKDNIFLTKRLVSEPKDIGGWDGQLLLAGEDFSAAIK